MKKYTIIALTLGLLLASCGGNKSKGLADGASGDTEAYESADVNAIVQAKPQIMIIPSDQTLKQFGCLKNKTIDGEKYMIRDYKKYLVTDDNFKTVTSNIQNRFIGADYPLDDFEQTLKSIDNQNAADIADNLAIDAKTRLLSVATPDIVLELDYDISADYTKSNTSDKTVRYLINAIDAYTNKVVATIQGDGLHGENGAAVMATDLDKTMPKLMGDIQKYFNDILTRGREITLRINVDADCNQKLTDQSVEGDTYADEIVDYIKTHSIKGAYKMQTNSANQLTFTNVRIKVLNDDGTQYGAYDWTRDLQKYLRKNLGLATENRAQGLGEVVLTIRGL